MQQHPGRIVQALDRITQVLDDEFDDLTPPDRHFVAHVLSVTYVDMFSKAVERRAP